MALDQNLFTLNIEPSKIDSSALDLRDPSGTVHYRKRLVPNGAETYLMSLSEPLSESLLATASAPAATTKEKVIELHNPSVTLKLTSKGTLTVKWAFTWEEQSFEWKKDECYILRKPDPSVLVAITKETANKTTKTTSIQILDYNLNRFDIEDRKGLEIVMITSFLTFGDMEQMKVKSNETPSAVPNVPAAGAAHLPPPPPKPEGWTEDQIAILQTQEQHDINEVVVGEQGDVDDYVKHCVSLLNDDTLLFITLRSLSPSCVAKVVQVAEATKRRRYKESGYDDDQELHQYVDTSIKGPRVIKLDDVPNRASTYQPPNTLTIHLSKVAMPELEPKSSRPKSSIIPSGKYTQVTSETQPPKLSISSQEKRQSSGAAIGSFGPPRQKPSASPPNGLYVPRGAFTPESLSSPSKSRPSSSHSASNKQPVSPRQVQQPLLGQSSRPPSQHHPLQSIPFHPPRAQNQSTFQLQGAAPQFVPYIHPPQQALRPVPVGNAVSYPSPSPLNMNLVNGMAPPQPQRASGKGFFSRR